MARPKSDDKRSAIMNAAIRVIADDGLGAATAKIAKEAGVSNGALFTYFRSKGDLLNQLYIELKTEMAAVGLDDRTAQRIGRDLLGESRGWSYCARRRREPSRTRT